MSEAIKVLITAALGAGPGAQVASALSQAASSYVLYATDADFKGNRPHWAHDYSQVPAADDTNYIKCIIDLCDRWSIRALIPGSEQELRLVSRHRDRFIAAGILLLINSDELIEIFSDKWKTATYLDSLGFKTPTSVAINDTGDLAQISDFPVVIKPRGVSSGSRNVFIAQSMSELSGIAMYLGVGEDHSSQFVVQSYVGTVEAEFTVGVLSNLTGNLIGATVMRRTLTGLSLKFSVKNRTYRTDLGEMLAVSSGISQGWFDDFTEVREQCIALAEACQSVGPMNIQCRIVNGTIVVFEVNPRFSGSTAGRALAGFNEPDLLLQDWFGVDHHQQPALPVRGQLVRNLVEDFQPASE